MRKTIVNLVSPRAPMSDDAPELTEFIQATDEANATSRPTNVGRFYVEAEYAHAEDEQRHAYSEKGEAEARPFDVTAKALEHDADHAVSASDAANQQSADTRARYEQAEKVLGPHVRRPDNVKWLYYLRYALILGGDIAGISGAALLLGEEPINAFLIAISAAVSAVTLGAVGREVRYLLAARARAKAPAELSEAERPYAAFFTGPHAGERIVKILLTSCAAGIALISIGILALRSSTEGGTAGAVFACVSLALGLASFYNAFDAGDDVAEHLDALIAKVAVAEKKAKTARQEPVIKDRARAAAEAQSTRSENQAAGEAAAAGIRRRLHAVLGASPGVAGNGYVPVSDPVKPSRSESETTISVPEAGLNGSRPAAPAGVPPAGEPSVALLVRRVPPPLHRRGREGGSPLQLRRGHHPRPTRPLSRVPGAQHQPV